MEWISLYLLPTNIYYIFEKFEHSNWIILLNIDDFMFLTPFSLIFGPLFDLLGVLWSINYLYMERISLYLLPNNLYYILEKFEHFKWIILLNIDDFIAILGPIAPLFAPGGSLWGGVKIWKVVVIIREECTLSWSVVICVFSSIRWRIAIKNCKNRLFS